MSSYTGFNALSHQYVPVLPFWYEVNFPILYASIGGS